MKMKADIIGLRDQVRLLIVRNIDTQRMGCKGVCQEGQGEEERGAVRNRGERGEGEGASGEERAEKGRSENSG